MAVEEPVLYDVKCTEQLRYFCGYCGSGSGLCNMCMMPATQKIALQGEMFAQVCASNCGSYFTIEEPMPLEVDCTKVNSKPLKFLTLSSNAVAFGITDQKGKVIIHVTKSDCPEVLTVLCCIRYATLQKVLMFNVTKGDFEPIEVDNTSASMEEFQISRVVAILADFKI